MNYKKTSMKTENYLRFAAWVLLLMTIIIWSNVINAATITTAGSGNWSSTTPNAPWPGGTIPAVGDDIIIGDGFSLTVNSNRTVKSVSYTAPNSGTGSGQLIINTGITLTLTTNLGAPSFSVPVKTTGTYYVSGGGTLNCANVNIGNLQEPGGSGSTQISLVLNNVITTITGNLAFYSTYKTSGNKVNNPALFFESGSLNVAGSITSYHENATYNAFWFVTYTGSQTGVLNLSGATPFNLSSVASNIFYFTGTSSVVNYKGTSAQLVKGDTYKTLKINNTHASGASLEAATSADTLIIGDESSAIFNDAGKTLTSGGAIQLVAGNFNIGSGALNTSFPGFTTNTIGSNTTVNYNSTGSQNIVALNYGNLTNSGNGARTLQSTGTIGVAGTFSPSTGANTVTGSTVNFNGSGSQSIPAFNFNNLTSSSSGARILASTGTIGAAGVFTPGTNSYTNTGSTLNFNGAFAQTIPAFNYNHLTSSSTGARTLASSGTVGIAGTFTIGTNAYTVTGSTVNFNGTISQTIPAFNYNHLTSSSSGGRILASTGTVGIAEVFTIGSNAYTISGSTVNFNGTGTQSIPAFDFNNLTSSSTGNRTLASSGEIGILGVFTKGTNAFTITGSTINYKGTASQNIVAFNYNNLTSSSSGARVLANSGTIGILNTFTTSSNSYTVTGSTIDFNGTTTQAIPGITYDNFTLSNTTSLCTASGSITVNSIFTTNNGSILVLNTNTLAVNSVAHAGTIRTQNTSSTPISINKTWGGTILLNGTSPQTLVVGTFQNVSITNTNGIACTGNVTINGALSLSTNPSATAGSLAMGANTLTLGSISSVSGNGDVSGIIKRTTILPNVEYTYGSPYTVGIFQNVGTIPSELSVKVTLGNAPAWNTGTVKRIYDVSYVNGAGFKALMKFHYQDSELNGNTENQLAIFRYRYYDFLQVESGKTNFNSTENWVELANVSGILTTMPFGIVEWSLANSSATSKVWNGSASTDWTNSLNWTGGIPGSTDMVTIPSTLGYYSPTFPSSTTVAGLFIDSNATVNGGTSTSFTVAGGNGAWYNLGTFNSGTSTVIFTAADATLSGETNFNNMTLNSGAILNITTNAVTRISGTLTNNGTLHARGIPNVIEYNGSNQTVLNPNGGSGGYETLILSGSGTKTMPSASLVVGRDFSVNGSASATALNAIAISRHLAVSNGCSFNTGSYTHLIGGNLTNNGTLTATGSTLNFNGTSDQTITSSGGFAANNLTISNTVGSVLLGTSSNLTVTGTLTVSSSAKLDLVSNNLSSVGTIANSGTIFTQSTGASPLPSGRTWGGTLNYNNENGGQTVVAGTYATFINGNTLNTNTASGNVSTTSFSTLTGGTLNMAGFILTGTTISNQGALRTQNTTAAPIPSNKTWSGTVIYDATSGGQTVMLGTYNNLFVSNASGTNNASGNMTIHEELNTTAGGTLNLGSSSVLSGLLKTINHNGIIKTAVPTSTSSTPIKANQTWSGTIEYTATAGSQSIVGGTFNNLKLSNTSGTNSVTGNLIVESDFTTSSGGTLNLGSLYTLSGNLTSINSNGIIKSSALTSTSSEPIKANRTWGGTIEYTASAGNQTVVGGTFENLTISNASGTNFASGNLTINNNLTTSAGGTLDLGSSFIINGSLTSISNNGTIKTSVLTSTSNTPIPANKTWGGIIEFYAPSGAQAIIGGTYSTLRLLNTLGINSTQGSLVVNNTLTTTSGGILNLGATNTLSGTLSTIDNNGTIRTGVATSVSATPIKVNTTWNGTIEFNGTTGPQTIVQGEYLHLKISNTQGVVASNHITVNGTLNASANNPNSTIGTLDMSSYMFSFITLLMAPIPF